MNGYEEEPTVETIRHLKAQGYSFSQIAKEYGKTRQSVSAKWRRSGAEPRRRRRDLPGFPWPDMPAQYTRVWAIDCILSHLQFMVHGEEARLSKTEQIKLNRFYTLLRIDDLVVEYDPKIPPNPTSQGIGGVAYRSRREEDGRLLVRKNEHTVITDDGKRLLVFPAFFRGPYRSETS